MDKFSTYAFCFIMLLIGLSIVLTCTDNRKIKDNSMIEEDFYVCGIDNSINTIIIEDVDSYD